MIGGAFVATSAVAQDVQPAPKTEQAAKQEAIEWDKKVKDELKLTDEQAGKYDAINKEAQKEKKMALKKEKQAKLMEVLSAEQQAKYKEMAEKKKKDAALKPA